jgi:diguanylate cyclase (GGDEF)-like protein
LLDIDNFKEVNDKFGHDEGENVIQKFSHTIKNVVGSTGIVGRYGGDEFLIILEDVELSQGKALATKLLKSINEITFDKGIKISASGGLSVYNGQQHIKDVISDADNLLYKIKSSGKKDILFEKDNEQIESK